MCIDVSSVDNIHNLFEQLTTSEEMVLVIIRRRTLEKN